MRTVFSPLVCLFMISILVASVQPQSAYARRTYVDQIATGAQHTCKILALQRTVFCWGDNTYGQLGDGSTTTRANPVQVLMSNGTPLKAKFISAGYAHTCAILQDNTIACWGANTFGQLGNGTRAVAQARPVIVISNPSTGRKKLYARDKITLGADHSCAFASTQTNASLSNSFTWCWGSNNLGQLSTGNTTTNSDGAYIVTISGTQKLPAISNISSGADRTCAITLSDGQVWCWGFDHWYTTYGKSTKTRATKIRNVKNNLLNDMQLVAVGHDHSCAQSKSNQVWCWGENESGQLGNNRTFNSYARAGLVKLRNGTNLSNVYAIDAGLDHTCALYLDNKASKLACWGYNELFQLGNSTDNFARSPTVVARLPTTLAAISAGGNHSCVITHLLTTNSRMFCWGHNMYGQIGKGDYVTSAIPSTIKFLSGDILY
jgi:alpha-tubulin suppressor-like RCC1 family protein